MTSNTSLKQFFCLLITIILSSCSLDKRDFVDDPNNVPSEINERVSTLNLINDDEKILACIYERSINIPSFSVLDEELLLLTDERFLRFFTYNSEKNVQEIIFSDCLHVEVDQSIIISDYVKYDIDAINIYELQYDQEIIIDLLPDFNSIYYGGNVNSQADYEAMNKLFIKAWKDHKNYDSLQLIYNQFYDKKGTRKASY